MKKTFLTLSLIFAILISFASKPHIVDVRVNPSGSTVKWIGSKLTSSHEGNVIIQKGVLAINHGTLVGGQISIDMNSITCTDIESPKKNKYLVDHLKNEDFFNTEKFPLAIIKITKAVRGKGNVYNIIADLTIKGITHPVAFDADVNINGENFLAKAKIIIDRTKWDVKYKSSSIFDDLGDNFIKDDVEFDVFLLSVK